VAPVSRSASKPAARTNSPSRHYSAPRFDYDDHLVYDRHGLVLAYPGIATRIL